MTGEKCLCNKKQHEVINHKVVPLHGVAYTNSRNHFCIVHDEPTPWSQ
ncbi:hypothetical protein OQJ19_15995 [Fluoribacter gormanii]|nr:hypothetical protein [Fluoribacter gormanii]MCW8472135.1 hypothetical protein [Fluoribacter gormanii]